MKLSKIILPSFCLLAVFSLLFQYYGRSWQHALFIKPLYQLNSDEKIVALTFDDGPSPIRTPPLLEILNKHQVKASFFMLGQEINNHLEIAGYSKANVLA